MTDAVIDDVLALAVLACDAARADDVALTAALLGAVRLRLREHAQGTDLEAEPVPEPKRRDAPEP